MGLQVFAIPGTTVRHPRNPHKSKGTAREVFTEEIVIERFEGKSVGEMTVRGV